MIRLGIVVALALAVTTFAIILAIWARRAQEQYDLVARPIILDILLTKKRISFQELCHQTHDRVKKQTNMTVTTDAMSPAPIQILRDLDKKGFIQEDEGWKTQDRKRWGMYRMISLTETGQAYARESLAVCA